MEVTFINVGYGDAILVQSEGFSMLVDGGSARAEEFEDSPYRIPAVEYIKQIGLSKIDVMVLSHIHEDHVCGLEAILDQLTVGEILFPYNPDLFPDAYLLEVDPSAPPSVHLFSEAACATVRILKTAKNRSIPVEMISAGKHLSLPSGIEIDVLAPVAAVRQDFEALLKEAFSSSKPVNALLQLDRTANNCSLLLKVSQKEIGILLPGDNCPDKWNLDDSSMLNNVNVLKLPHHGQIDSVNGEILNQIPLTHVITTASSDRRYNSANSEVYNTLLHINPEMTLLFTDERDYPPYFRNPNGARAVKLVIDSCGIHTEFIR